LHRSDLLAQISCGDKFFIGYAGTHGKTTTSGMAAYVLDKAGHAPSSIVGGFVPELDANARATQGKYFVAELDESDGTLTKYAPDIAVINNMEPDHLDFFTDGMDGIFKVFGEFASKSKKVIVNNDDENVRKSGCGIDSNKVVTFGLNNADYTARNITYGADFTTFEVYFLFCWQNPHIIVYLKSI
jgi:UDP-N-acetylmuramate--alanine ligase